MDVDLIEISEKSFEENSYQYICVGIMILCLILMMIKIYANQTFFDVFMFFFTMEGIEKILAAEIVSFVGAILFLFLYIRAIK